jgi:hypothetical protein
MFNGNIREGDSITCCFQSSKPRYYQLAIEFEYESGVNKEQALKEVDKLVETCSYEKDPDVPRPGIDWDWEKDCGEGDTKRYYEEDELQDDRYD